MKVLVNSPMVRNLPVIQIMEVATSIMNYSLQVEQIKREYKLKKAQMKQHFALERQKLDNDLAYFREMAALQSQQFEISHVERMQLLNTVHELSSTLPQLTDYASKELYRELIKEMLSRFSQSRIDHVNFIEQTQVTPILGGE